MKKKRRGEKSVETASKEKDVMCYQLMVRRSLKVLYCHRWCVCLLRALHDDEKGKERKIITPRVSSVGRG